MTGHKQIEQALKRPDSFQDTTLKVLEYIKANRQKVFLMTLPILLVAGVGYGLYAMKQNAGANRRVALAKIIALESEEGSSTEIH